MKLGEWHLGLPKKAEPVKSTLFVSVLLKEKFPTLFNLTLESGEQRRALNHSFLQQSLDVDKALNGNIDPLCGIENQHYHATEQHGTKTEKHDQSVSKPPIEDSNTEQGKTEKNQSLRHFHHSGTNTATTKKAPYLASAKRLN